MGKSFWDALPKSSGLGKLSKKSRQGVSKLDKRRTHYMEKTKPIIKKRQQALNSPERKAALALKKQARLAAKKTKATVAKPKPATWHFWGSRQTLMEKDKVVASLKRQGYKVRVDGVGDYYKIYTMGRASKYS